MEYTTWDNVPVTVGLQVWTNEYEQGTVTAVASWAADYGQPAWNAWHEVTYPSGRTVHMNRERLSVRKPF